MFVSEEGKYVNLLPPKDINSAAHSAAYFSMALYHSADVYVTFGANGAVGSSKNITFTQAINTSGSSSAALPIGTYRSNLAALASASIANDTLNIMMPMSAVEMTI